ncbi:hypothetical protein G3570_09710 [Balneolaceae bacterium YR4-1]|uniref:Acetylglutamate kinase n=1 Tax=Halalkalibaculum roseum TaxID=2709311 RepID=A0A6M1SP95_9BACT|nr:hypothetical protein [Halalkalibaculum roseum]NGP76909.1 hypothetical protein [Halalkalibaculum roseum]
MQYLAALDYEHLDNGVFLTSLARSISRQKNVRPILLHGDSEYTERVIQTGVMREEATIRSIKGLNHRLIALLADQGVSTIGINGYQREFITLKNDTLSLDKKFFDSLPGQSALLISTLVLDASNGRPTPVPLTKLALFLRSKLNLRDLFIFSASDADEIFTQEEKPDKVKWSKLDEEYQNVFIPKEFTNFGEPVRLTTARDFDQVPDLSKTSLIH